MAERQQLLELLERARTFGLLGPGPVDAHLDHAEAWADVLGPSPESFLDLGSGAGIPGLALLLAWPTARGTLLDARRRSAELVEAAAADLGLGDRATVVEARAEAAGRDEALRERFPLVVARGFGSPPETAECGAAFVTPGGRLSVSEPPGGDPDRWPEAGLVELGLRVAEVVSGAGGSFVILEKVGGLSDRFPRPVGRPRKRPLW